MSEAEKSAPITGSSTPVHPAANRRLTDPAPVLGVGVLVWLTALIVVLLSGDRWSYALPTCWAGLIMGIVGFSLFVVQRRAARSGSKTAQRGLT